MILNESMIIFIILNVIGFMLMAFDKFRAVRHQYRVPEKVLLSVALIGGGIGSLIGMQLFSHKTRKPVFMYGIPLMIIAQLYLYYNYFI
ncbi:MAG: DUF1294 domain-containing protein [Eubacteriaceae bacterium]|nr:DUF1294 domain-containing protein [Eubacteriaceae bacterium]